MNAAQLLVRCLENEGVRYVFGIPGEETLDLNAALEDSDAIQFVLTRHEQAAAFMADVYGRLSSYPGVCLATLGPGATNLLTGVADAQLDREPVQARDPPSPTCTTSGSSAAAIDRSVPRLQAPGAPHSSSASSGACLAWRAISCAA